MEKAGVYLHVPFCARRCPYCDFYSRRFDAELAGRYIDAAIRQLESTPRRAADTLYIGGGTPSLLGERDVARVVDAAARRFGLDAQSEVTLELNPETATRDKLAGLRAAGVNRLSVGVQSLDDGILGRIGRGHTAAQAVEAIQTAAACGFDNLSADLMLGLPGQTLGLLRDTVHTLGTLPLSHVSAYLLKIAAGTPFGVQAPPGIPDDDAQAELYERCAELLEQQGFRQYEISNFARGEKESRHNLKYWDCGDYLALGPAAHASLDGQRYSFTPDLALFLARYGENAAPRPYLDEMTPEGAVTAQDYIMLRLRLNAGLDRTLLYKKYNYRFDKHIVDIIENFERMGLMTLRGDTVALTRRGMLLSNSILSQLI